jgi:hypothetical protein
MEVTAAMPRISQVACGVLFASLIVASPPVRAATQKGYVLFLNQTETSWADLVNVDRTGWVTYRNGFDMHFRDPYKIVLSKDGKHAFLWDFNDTNAVLFAVSQESTFTLTREFTGGCSGGGFTTDSAYLFKNGNIYDGSRAPRLEAYRLSTGSCDLVSSRTVPTTATLKGTYHVNRFDEVNATCFSAYLRWELSSAVYQFSRATKALTLKQWIRDVIYVESAMSPSEELIPYWGGGRALYLMRRQTDGIYKENYDSWWNPQWQNGWPAGVVFTPDSKYAIMAVESGWDAPPGWGGVQVLTFTADRKFQPVYFTNLYEAYEISITPDGKFVAAAWQDYSRGYLVAKLRIYRVNTNGTLTAICDTILPSLLGCMGFLPQAVPKTAADGVWPKYAEKKAGEERRVDSGPWIVDSGEKKAGGRRPEAVAGKRKSTGQTPRGEARAFGKEQRPTSNPPAPGPPRVAAATAASRDGK